MHFKIVEKSLLLYSNVYNFLTDTGQVNVWDENIDTRLSN